MLVRVSCIHKSSEACCYFLSYKMSLQNALKDSEKTMNGKSCVSCNEDGSRACVGV